MSKEVKRIVWKKRLRKNLSKEELLTMEAQNVGLVGFTKNLGISLLDPRDVADVTPLDDMLNLYDLFQDSSLELREIVIRKEGSLAEWAFLFDDVTDEEDVLYYYPVTKMVLHDAKYRGMVDSILTVYGVSIPIEQLISGADGYYNVTPKAVFVKTGDIKKQVFATPAAVGEAIKELLTTDKPIDEAISDMVKRV